MYSMSSDNEVIKDVTVNSRISDSSTEFTVHFNTPLAPSVYRTGQVFKYSVIDPTLTEGHDIIKGVLEKVFRDDTNSNRIYEIYGRDVGRLLMKQPFKYDCTKPENNVNKTVLEFLQLILQDTGISVGRGQTQLQNVILNTSENNLNRFCGSWDTKKDAINALFTQYVKITGINKLRWFIDLGGYFHWFETKTDRFDYNYIFKDDDRITSFQVTEDATNIVNRITGYAGTDNNITVTLNDTASQSKYGICIGPDISESDMTQAQLQAAVQLELDQKSSPIYTATVRMSGFYDYEKGTQIQFPNDPYYSDKTFTITDRTYQVDPTTIYSEFQLSTDETVVSVANEFDTVWAAAQAEASKVKSQTGTAKADAASGRVLIYVNETGTVENVRSP